MPHRTGTRLWQALAGYFGTGPDLPQRPLEPAALRREYERRRWMVFLSVTFGYGFFYLCRLSFSMAKKPMLDAGVLSESEMGYAGSVMLLVYSLGRFTNGVLADRANIRRFVSLGLLGSALAHLLLGWTRGAVFFSVLWAVNGWFQSMGSAPCIVSLTQWFSASERGTRYGLWSIAHGIGEGLSFLLTSMAVAAWGWQWGFFCPGLFCLLVSFVLLRTLMDRPLTYGLPRVDVYRDDPEREATPEGGAGQRAQQWAVLRNWRVWVLGLSGALIYITRYGINNWGSLYLQEARGYSGVEAGTLLAVQAVLGLLGSSLSGWISDRFFGARRNMLCLVMGVMLVAGMTLLWLAPPGQRWLDTLALSLVGLSLGGLVVYLGGLMAADIVPQQATGTAMGLVGLLCYLGAAVQDGVSGELIGQGRRAFSGAAAYHEVMMFWVAAAALAVLLTIAVQKQRR
ncbi:MAG: MFS transporter [Myxococcales bacterium]|nr:MFS transporter [Myxococcales bacterium]